MKTLNEFITEAAAKINGESENILKKFGYLYKTQSRARGVRNYIHKSGKHEAEVSMHHPKVDHRTHNGKTTQLRTFKTPEALEQHLTKIHTDS